MPSFEENLNKAIELSAGNNVQLNPSTQLFEEQMRKYKEDDFSMPSIGSFTKVSNANVIVIALGVLTASYIGNMLTRFVPQVGKFAPILAGALIIVLGKNRGMLKDFGIGVLIGGLVELGRGYMPGMSMPMNRQVEEDRMTYGGTDGVYPVQPDRRVFQ